MQKRLHLATLLGLTALTLLGARPAHAASAYDTNGLFIDHLGVSQGILSGTIENTIPGNPYGLLSGPLYNSNVFFNPRAFLGWNTASNTLLSFQTALPGRSGTVQAINLNNYAGPQPVVLNLSSNRNHGRDKFSPCFGRDALCCRGA